MIYILSVLLPLIVNAASAKYQASVFDRQKSISHLFWAILYAVFCAGIYFATRENIMSVIDAVLVRMVFFNVLLNYFRHPRKPIFYINSKPNGGSIVDRIEIFVYGKYYPYIVGVYIAALVFVTIKL